MNGIELSKEQLLELIRSALWDREPNLELFRSGSINWNEILTLGKQQTVLGLVSLAIEKLPNELRPNRATIIRLHSLLTVNRQYYSKQAQVLGELLEILSSLGVTRPVLLKGLGISSNYIDPSVRACGDIDLYVGEKNYDKVCNFLLKKFSLDVEEAYEDDVHFQFKINDIDIEIHKYASTISSILISKRKDFKKWSQECLDGDQMREIEIEGVKVLVPPIDFDIFYIFYHSWRHLILGGIAFRQICDWCRLIEAHYGQFDSEILEKRLTEYKLIRPFRLFSAIAVEKLGLNADKLPLYDKSKATDYREVLGLIWEGGNFGIYNAKDNSSEKKTLIGSKLSRFKVKLSFSRLVYRIDPVYAMSFYSSWFFAAIGRLYVKIFKIKKR